MLIEPMSDTARRTPVSARTAQAVACLALVAISAPLYARYYLGTTYLDWLFATVALGAASSLLTLVRRIGWRLAITVSLVALLVFLRWALYRSMVPSALPGLTSLRTVGSGVWHGLARMLTTSVPADAEPDLLAVPVTVTWVCAFAAVALALRVRSPLLPILPGLTSFVAALLLTADSAPMRIATTAGWILIALLCVVLRAGSASAGAEPSATTVTARRGRVALAAMTLAVIVSLTMSITVASPLGATNRRFQPGALVEDPVRTLDGISPLSLVEGQRDQRPAETIMTVTFSGAHRQPPVDMRVRVAALDTFSGAIWTVGGLFTRASSQLSADGGGHDITTMTVRETRADPYGSYLPQVGRPATLHGTTAYFDRGNDQLVAGSARVPSYTIGTHTTRYTKEDVLRAAPELSGNDELPKPIPDTLLTFARSVAASSSTMIGRLATILSRVRALRYSSSAPPGSSYFALVNLINHDVGNIEQHVALFVVSARLLGIPARVAVGYTLDTREARGSKYSITPADAYAWAEVPFKGLGWVSFDPIRLTRAIATKPPPTSGITQSDSLGQGNGPGKIPANPGPSATAGSWQIWVWSALVAVILLLGSIPQAKFVIRRRRRARGNPGTQIVGAWLSMLELLRENGVHVPASLTPHEAALLTDERIGDRAGAPLHAIAPLVAAALYAPVGPPAGDASQAWESVDGLRRTTRERMTWWRRLIAPFDVRGLPPIPSVMRASLDRRAAAVSGIDLPR